MNEHETLPENNKLVLKHFATIGNKEKRPSVLNPVKTMKNSSPVWSGPKNKQSSAVDELAKELVDKVEYD